MWISVLCILQYSQLSFVTEDTFVTTKTHTYMPKSRYSIFFHKSQARTSFGLEIYEKISSLFRWLFNILFSLFNSFFGFVNNFTDSFFNLFFRSSSLFCFGFSFMQLFFKFGIQIFNKT